MLTEDFFHQYAAMVQPPPKDLAGDGTVGGIVTEYNPFHAGHRWMIEQMRAGGIKTVVCVMSGPFVQRAEGAILPTHLRARAALCGGADLVLRLPAPWAAASAEAFARGSVGLLSALGCVDMLVFGAECRQTEQLEAVAGILENEAFPALLKEQLATGISFAAARAAAAEKLMPGAAVLLASPNNILGIEYIKALRTAVPAALRAKMAADVQWQVIGQLYGNTPSLDALFMLPVPTALPRVGAAHDGAPADGFASASWLRQQAQQHGVESWRPYVPEACMPLYEKAQKEGSLLDAQRFETMVLGRLRGMEAAEFARYTGAGEGLENRLAAAVQQATSLDELYELAKTKRFAHSRVRRLALSAALRLPAEVPVLPPFAHVLAASPRGLALLRQAKSRAMLPISTSLAKLAATGPAAARIAKTEAEAEDLHALCLKKPRPGGGAYTQPAFIQPGKATPKKSGGPTHNN